MSGTPEGGKKARATNLKIYGADFYSRIGRIGGRNGHNGGFASEKVGTDGLTGAERARIAGAKGGRNSSRLGIRNGEGKNSNKDIDEIERILEEEA